jgi:hypothetical protein
MSELNRLPVPIREQSTSFEDLFKFLKNIDPAELDISFLDFRGNAQLVTRASRPLAAIEAKSRQLPSGISTQEAYKYGFLNLIGVLMNRTVEGLAEDLHRDEVLTVDMLKIEEV